MLRKHPKPSSGSASNIIELETVEQVREWRAGAREQGRRVALVPTMGALHRGHLDLIKTASRSGEEVCVSIFVNPTQFGPTEDLATYPRTLEADLELLRNLKDSSRSNAQCVHAVLIPSVETMYPSGLESPSSVVIDPRLAQILEGKARPHFFQGVATVVMKLMNIVQPDITVLGQKDVQQLVVVEHMVREFHLKTRIVAGITARESNGLAQSSRNAYLGKRRRAVASVLYRALLAGREAFSSGARGRGEILEPAMAKIRESQQKQLALPLKQRVAFHLDYLSLASRHDLQEIDSFSDGNRRAVLSGAVVMLPLEEPGPDETDPALRRPVRIIDNLVVQDRKPSPERLERRRRDEANRAKSVKSNQDEEAENEEPRMATSPIEQTERNATTSAATTAEARLALS